MRHSGLGLALVVTSLLAVAACSDTLESRAANSPTTVAGASTTSSIAAVSTTSIASGTGVVGSSSQPATPSGVSTTSATAKPTTPATTAPSGPRITSYTIKLVGVCIPPGPPPAPDVSVTASTTIPPTVSITWKATGADSVYVAIDNANGPWQVGLPLNGTFTDLPYTCGQKHTFFVVAVKGTQKDVKSKSFNL
jgi:hypothetical protein